MDWKTVEDGPEKLNMYWCSREWGLLREAVRRRCAGICERCRLQPMYACHHLTYGTLFHETIDVLWGLCYGCHEYMHGRSDVDPGSGSDEVETEYDDQIRSRGRQVAEVKDVPDALSHIIEVLCAWPGDGHWNIPHWSILSLIRVCEHHMSLTQKTRNLLLDVLGERLAADEDILSFLSLENDQLLEVVLQRLHATVNPLDLVMSACQVQVVKN